MGDKGVIKGAEPDFEEVCTDTSRMAQIWGDALVTLEELARKSNEDLWKARLSEKWPGSPLNPNQPWDPNAPDSAPIPLEPELPTDLGFVADLAIGAARPFVHGFWLAMKIYDLLEKKEYSEAYIEFSRWVSGDLGALFPALVDALLDGRVDEEISEIWKAEWEKLPNPSKRWAYIKAAPEHERTRLIAESLVELCALLAIAKSALAKGAKPTNGANRPGGELSLAELEVAVTELKAAAGKAKQRKAGARPVPTPLGAPIITGSPTYSIIEGVRRSKAKQLTKKGTIRAEITKNGVRVEIRDVSIDSLRSPKDIIETTSHPSGTAMARWRRIYDAEAAGKNVDQSVPIIIEEGTAGIPIKDVIVEDFP